MNLSPHFKRSEFACKDNCGMDTVDYELLNMLERIRAHFEKPVIITSGCRCKVHNQEIGGSIGSQHLYGRAADFVVKGISPETVHDFINAYSPHKWGLGLYDSWVHLDTRTGKARWDNTT